MEIIKRTGPEQPEYERYETLLLERDQLSKEAGQIWTAYVVEFGRLTADIFECKVDCIRRRKTIEYYQRSINRGEPVDPDAMQDQIGREMVAYEKELRRMIEDTNRCREAKTSTPYEVQRSKTLYRRLAKRLHPDINPHTDREEKLRDLWNRICTAYAANDIRALSELEVLTGKALREPGIGEIHIDIPRIADRIEELEKEIEEILHTEPYTHKTLLEDEKAVAERKKALREELQTWQKYRAQLDQIIEDLHKSGTLTFSWTMQW